MANREHLAIFEDALAKNDISIWNHWREINPGVIPNMSKLTIDQPITYRVAGGQVRGYMPHLNLENINLAGAHLGDAELMGSNLNDADLSHAYLGGANFGERLYQVSIYRHHDDIGEREKQLNSFLQGADLSHTDCTRASFSRAVCDRAKFSGAVLTRTDFTDASLVHGDFTGAIFQKTYFLSNDLSMVTGLETVQHKGPSYIGIDTLYKSRGNIPEIFLRGCGVPDTMITFAKSLVSKAIEYYSCFISYSSADEIFARRLHNDLQANGVRVWFAPHDLGIGDKFRNEIDEAVRLYDKLVIVLSKNSLKSDWVETEIETAFEKERRLKKHRGKDSVVLFPIRLDEAVMRTKQAWAADIRRTRHIGDFSKWDNPLVYQDAMNRLLRDLNARS